VKRPAAGNASESATVALDATVVIHLAQAGRLDLLGSIQHYEFVVPDQAAEEVTYPEQKAALQRALGARHLQQESSTDPAEMALYAELRQRMGKGEAACLAMATCRGWMLASDDRGRAFRRFVREHKCQDRLIDTQTIVNLALEQGVVSAEEAEDIMRPKSRTRA